MTQSLLNFMNSYWQIALLFLLVLMLILLVWTVYRYREQKKRQIASSENHPVIPRRFYKISEVGQSRLNQAGVEKPSVGQATAEVTKAYKIPAGLWDI